MKQHEIWMLEAFKEAQKAFDNSEVPVGAVIVFENRIIAKAHNQVETLKDPTAHAEILALTSAASYLSSKVLLGCSMYVTLEPCPMCAGASMLSKIENIYFGAFDNKAGACGSIINLTANPALNHCVSTHGGILDLQCRNILQEFFQSKRQNDGD
jgi:tRNA(adenine34) deaminase